MSVQIGPDYVVSNYGQIYIYRPAPPAGAYWIGGRGKGIALQLHARPFLLHRLAMRAVFGWHWQDAAATEPKERP